MKQKLTKFRGDMSKADAWGGIFYTIAGTIFLIGGVPIAGAMQFLFLFLNIFMFYKRRLKALESMCVHNMKVHMMLREFMEDKEVEDLLTSVDQEKKDLRDSLFMKP